MIEFFTSMVLVVEGEPRVSTEVIARAYELQHKNVIALVRKHQARLEKSGPIAFQTRNPAQQGGRPTEFAALNQIQSMKLLTYMNNSEKVLDFKDALIDEFQRLAGQVRSQEKTLWAQMQALIAREAESAVRASFGSHLMLERKREIPQFDEERYRLESQIQPSLLTH